MNYLDLYLIRNNCKRYDVHKKTGISQQLLSTHTKKEVGKYSVKVLTALADTLGKTSGEVLDELFALEKENLAWEVFNPEELLIGLKDKWDIIIIKGAYAKEIYKLMKYQLSETELMGMELGSAGVLSVFAYAIDSVRDLFSNLEKIDKDIETKLRLYKLKEVSDDKLVLSLKQLDY
ncbi:XRE family transcriptional regulator [Romboutsia weinsteinii]|uniref:XRE family transcriptional regulator n=1 Tax=Romboutsia weinsteinii TaxID=2020949 RepID=A0A371J2D4_9FIRM|nr:helix-turn-helix domain-containing protein [Romboutsia weinsteinii]RDY26854.1 XRE family transcriptional regulator [Romboutsia weinsteinii]